MYSRGFGCYSDRYIQGTLRHNLHTALLLLIIWLSIFLVVVFFVRLPSRSRVPRRTGLYNNRMITRSSIACYTTLMTESPFGGVDIGIVHDFVVRLVTVNITAAVSQMIAHGHQLDASLNKLSVFVTHVLVIYTDTKAICQ